jgi:hypothetical protein
MGEKTFRKLSQEFLLDVGTLAANSLHTRKVASILTHLGKSVTLLPSFDLDASR